MDNETILKLYENFSDDIYTMTVEKMDISKKLSKQQDKLNATLTKEQKEMLNRLNELENKKNELVYQNTFVFAYQLATKLIIEGLSGKNKVEDLIEYMPNKKE